MAITREEREILKAELKDEMRKEMEEKLFDKMIVDGGEPTFDMSIRNSLRGRERNFTGSIVEKYITFQKGVTDYNIPPSHELEGASILGFKVVDPSAANTFTPYSIVIDVNTGEVNIKLTQPVQDNTSCIISFRK